MKLPKTDAVAWAVLFALFSDRRYFQVVNGVRNT